MLTISCDDGAKSDLKLAELARKYCFPLVFYWPVEWTGMAFFKGYEPLDYDEAYDLAQEFELGSHTITHRHLTNILTSEACYEISQSKLMLEQLFDTEISKFAPPRGYTNDELTKFTLENYDSQRLTKQNNLVHIHPESGVNDKRNWIECINQNTTELFCHSFELDKYNMWAELEHYLENSYS